MKTNKSEIEVPVYLPGPKVCARYNVTDMTIHRWLIDDAMQFPRPYYFGRFRYWRQDELQSWERSQPRARCSKVAERSARSISNEGA